MIIKLASEFYCPILDDLFNFYIILGNTLVPTPKRIFVARKYLEYTQYSVDEIILKTRLKLSSNDFNFEGRFTQKERNSFVLHFEGFITYVIKLIEYINGTVLDLN